MEHNVLNDVRGTGYFLEDGNELWNRMHYNVALCPYPLDSEFHGCTIPGTDNGQVDTAMNQAGIWSTAPLNSIVGNRASGSFNAMFMDLAAYGRGSNWYNMCPVQYPLGRLEGNTFHNSLRFGTYLLGYTPTQVSVSVESNGLVTDRNECLAYTEEGVDNGYPCKVSNNYDYYNVFVGQS